MSDKYIQIASFKYGLDARRQELVSQPGVLSVCENAHINSGGEIEKRKAFVRLDGVFDDSTFGLQDTDQGLMTFGSRGSGGVSLPTGVVYQQLAYPYPTDPSGVVTMSAVVYSCNYLGKAFVIAEYYNGERYFFYDGVMVGQSRAGHVVFFGANPEAVSDLSNDLATQVNLIDGWLAKANTDATPWTGAGVVANPVAPYLLNEFSNAGSTLIESPPGIHFTPVVSARTTLGLIGVQLIDQNFAGTGAQGASVAFTINGGSPTNTLDVQAPLNQDGTDIQSITNGPVLFAGNNVATATAVAAAINRFTYITGYVALAIGTTVTVTTPAAFGNVVFNLSAIGTGAMSTVAGTIAGNFILSLNVTSGISPGNLLEVDVIGTTDQVVSGTAYVSTTGATGTVTYLWTETNSSGVASPGLSGIGMSSTTGATVTFSKLLIAGGGTLGGSATAVGYFKCVATDSGGASGSPATLFMTVHLTLSPP